MNHKFLLDQLSLLGGIIAVKLVWKHAFGLVAIPGLIVAILFLFILLSGGDVWEGSYQVAVRGQVLINLKKKLKLFSSFRSFYRNS